MSGGQHNPNGRQAQLGSAWNHLQVPYLGRVPQAAHMASERAGVTWHTPTPPPPPSHHPYLGPVPAAVSPDPLQALKVSGVGGNALYRHTPTPPDRDSAILYRHTPPPPDKLFRHTPSPGDPKVGTVLPPADIYPLPREKLRAEELLAYTRGGVDLTLGRPPSNGAPLSLSVRDAPTINSLISAATARPPHAPRPAHARVDALLERLAPAPHSPHSVIVHPRAAPSPSPPDSNEDSTDSCGAPPGAKRKRKPERTVRVPAPAPPPPPPPPAAERLAPVPAPAPEPLTASPPLENGDGPHEPAAAPPSPGLPHTRRKTKSGSSETIDDIAAMIASTDRVDGNANLDSSASLPKPPEPDEPPATIEVLKKVLGSPEPAKEVIKPSPSEPPTPASNEPPSQETPVRPKRRSTRSSRSDTSNAQEASTSEAKPSERPTETVPEEKKSDSGVPTFVEVENQLEQMFAGIEEEKPAADEIPTKEEVSGAKKRQRSRTGRKPARGKGSRRSSGAASTDDTCAPKSKIARKKSTVASARKQEVSTKEGHRDAYDSGSNASSGRSRGPYVQIRGPRDSPLYVNVVNAATAAEDDCDGAAARPRPTRRKGSADGDFRNGLKTRGLHCSTLSIRYDATTPDASWVCAFCELGPHAGVKERLEGPVRPLGDLFGPYTISTDCEEYRGLEEQRRRWHAGPPEERESREVWFHEECGVWAPGLVAAGARLSGLEAAVWAARGARCGRCGRGGAGVACATRACPARAHVNCARASLWRLLEEEFRAFCPRHARA